MYAAFVVCCKMIDELSVVSKQVLEKLGSTYVIISQTESNVIYSHIEQIWKMSKNYLKMLINGTSMAYTK